MMQFSRKNMMRTAAMLLCSVSLVLPALAQNGATNSGAPDQAQGPGGGHRRGGSPEERLAKLQKDLNLTPDQSAKIKTIYDDGQAQMMAARKDTATPQADKRAKMMEMMKTQNDSIKAVLDDTQKAKFEEIQKHQREEMKERRAKGAGDGAAPPPPPPAPEV